MAVFVCIPAYNEAETIARTIIAARELPQVEAVLVIDDGSADGTASRAAEVGATVIVNAVNQGKGAALELLAQTLEQPAPLWSDLKATDILLLLDADIGSSAQAAAALLEPVIQGRA
ncbi:MAG: glycosyltransferase, partial [Coriobacteriaceae bacterium]|nr:glycosyltransferase [Coriobacteriaceae bacterium]